MRPSEIGGVGGPVRTAPVEEPGGGFGEGRAGTGAWERGRYAEYVALRSELRDMEDVLEMQRKAAHRHFIWAFLGLSPAAFLPLIGLLRSDSFLLVAALGVLVTAVELARGLKARRNFFRVLEGYEEQKARLRTLGPW